jgi:NADH:ubiquinone oxidoreductase subunit 3 (subunit A)
MKKIKVVFDEKSDSILNLLSQCNEHELIKYDCAFSDERKKGMQLMRKYGALTIPFIAFENEKGIEYKMIWVGDTNQPTVKEINKILNE